MSCGLPIYDHILAIPQPGPVGEVLLPQIVHGQDESRSKAISARPPPNKTTMPALPPAVSVHPESFNQPPASVARKWTGPGLGKSTDTPAYGNGSTKKPKQDHQSSNNLDRKPSEKVTARGRPTSLRHAKNSKEVLRQRSANRGNKDVAPDGTSGGREGRQFTVANVGNNGRIYLRYDYILSLEVPLLLHDQTPPGHRLNHVQQTASTRIPATTANASLCSSSRHTTEQCRIRSQRGENVHRASARKCMV